MREAIERKRNRPQRQEVDSWSSAAGEGWGCLLMGTGFLLRVLRVFWSKAEVMDTHYYECTKCH